MFSLGEEEGEKSGLWGVGARSSLLTCSDLYFRSLEEEEKIFRQLKVLKASHMPS
jgi:hypothetical protein